MNQQARTTTTHPADVLKATFDSHPAGKVAISFSGAEDVVLIDMAVDLVDELRVFCLDTGRLHPETYQFIETVRNHYGLDIDMLGPDPREVARLVKTKGLFSFYQDGHQECCAIRKIAPLQRYLAGLDGWITGQRHDQSPTRAGVPQVQDDTAFSDDRRTLKKYNPLADWTSAQVWDYIRDNQVPYNPLHDRGFVSIGCEPCTRPVGPNMHERSGRWWWEEATQKECGLHVINVKRLD